MKSPPDVRRHRAISGFTLLELVIVIAIIGILVGLLMPAVQHVRESARRTLCLDRLRQIGIAVHQHHDVNGCVPPRPFSGQPDDPSRVLLWQALILPYIEQQPLWERSVEACRLDPMSHHNPPHIGNGTVLTAYVCPSDSRLLVQHTWDGSAEAFSSYLGVSGSRTTGTYYGVPGQLLFKPAEGVFGQIPGIGFSEITDGMSQTLMAGERPPPGTFQAGQWYSNIMHGQFPGPNGFMQIPSAVLFPQDPCVPSEQGFGPGRIDNPCDRYHFWSQHPTGANFVLADGSCRFFAYSGAEMMPGLATRSRGEAIELR